MSRISICLPVALIAMAGVSFAAGFGTVCPNELKSLIFEDKPVHVVDVQTPAEYAEHNYEGSVSAVTAETLDALADKFARDDAPVVIVGESGGETEEKAAGQLASRGVRPSRLRILEGGMRGALAASNVCDCCNAGGKPK